MEPPRRRPAQRHPDFEDDPIIALDFEDTIPVSGWQSCEPPQRRAALDMIAAGARAGFRAARCRADPRAELEIAEELADLNIPFVFATAMAATGCRRRSRTGRRLPKPCPTMRCWPCSKTGRAGGLRSAHADLRQSDIDAPKKVAGPASRCSRADRGVMHPGILGQLSGIVSAPAIDGGDDSFSAFSLASVGSWSAGCRWPPQAATPVRALMPAVEA